MRESTLRSLSAEQLEEYAQAMGFTLRACKDKEDKIALIRRRRARSVTIEVLGLALDVEVRRFRSSRFSDAIKDRERTTDQLLGAFRDLLGDEQFDRLLDVCSDEDGETDDDALVCAFNAILRSDELKNY